MRRWVGKGLSLAEVIVAIAILAITLFSLMTVLVSGMQSDKKAFLLAAASNVADTQLDRAVQAVQADQPAGSRAALWDQDYPRTGSPWLSGSQTVSHTRFDYAIYAISVRGTDGLPVGDPDHRLKELDITVRWHDSSTTKLGQGETKHHQRRLLSEVSSGG